MINSDKDKIQAVCKVITQVQW